MDELDIKSKKPINGASEGEWGLKLNEIVDLIEDKVNEIVVEGDWTGGSGGAVTSVAGRTGDVVLSKTDVGLSNVNNTTDLLKPISTATQTALNLKEDKSNKNVANGYVGLTANVKIPIELIPSALVSGVSYLGSWDASTNTPTLSAIPNTKGEMYLVSTSGTQFGIDFYAGDAIISYNTYWERIGQNVSVSSVSGKTGVVVLDKSDVGLSNVDNTADSTKEVLSATKLTTARNITLDGEVSGTVSFDGSDNVTITTTTDDTKYIKWSIIFS